MAWYGMVVAAMDIITLSTNKFNPVP